MDQNKKDKILRIRNLLRDNAPTVYSHFKFVKQAKIKSLKVDKESNGTL